MEAKVLSKADKLQAKLDAELDAMQDYYERTGRFLKHLSPTQQRKVIENFKENKCST